MPEGSWEMVKKIIRAYRAAETDENPTVESIARMAGVHRPVVSMNNNFLRGIEIVQPEKNKLTELGARLAAGLSMGSAALVRGSIQSICRRSQLLGRLLNMLEARSGMDVQEFRAELVLLGGLKENSRQMQYAKTIIDMLLEGDLIRVADNNISLAPGIEGGGAEQQRDSPRETSNIEVAVSDRIPLADSVQVAVSPKRTGVEVPLALGPSRLVYLILPSDWDPTKDLKKFLKLAELALGDATIE
jgi:hypothetical protein